MFNIEKTDLDDVILINLFFAQDMRGGFVKYFETEAFKRIGIEFNFSEILASTSHKNVIRGLHFQRPNAQAKIVSVPNGAVLDVVVDLRYDSPNFKKYISVEISSDNHRAIFVPRGFAHGFLSLADNTVVSYFCDGPYDRKSETGIRFDDPSIGIKWPIKMSDVTISDRDLSFSYFDNELHAF